MSDPLACLDCGMVDPRPEQTCPGSPDESLTVLVLRDHFRGDGPWLPGVRASGSSVRGTSVLDAAGDGIRHGRQR